MLIFGWMSFYTYAFLSASVYIPGIIGLVRFNKVEASYYPFIYFVWAGCINELISIMLILNRKSNYVNSNVYVLIASILLIWFFNRNRLFGKSNFPFLFITTVLMIVWCAEIMFLKNIAEITSIFRILFSFIVTLLSIQMINTLLISGTKKLIKNSLFLICLAFALYFTYRMVVEAFWIYGLKSSTSFQLLIWDITVFVNLFTNLIYAIALLWTPKKKPSILPY